MIKKMHNLKKMFVIFASFLLIFALLPVHSKAESNSDFENTPELELWNAVNPLNTTVSFMMTGAHPDDERSNFLAYLSRGLGLEATSIIANRGEGGQNQMGSELGNPLGIIRSNEMIEAAKITNVATFHLSETTSDPIYDFGFSKTPEETLEIWGEEVTYERLIRKIRTLKPEILMPAFRDVPSQHGHHRVMSILPVKAFKDAADPNMFPEHIEQGLDPWQVKKLYLPAGDTVTHSIDISAVDPHYGITYSQLGEASRYLHKSQGMGREIPTDEEVIVDLELLEDVTDPKNDTNSEENDEFFDGIPYDFAAWADLVEADAPDVADELRELHTSLKNVVDAHPSAAEVFTTSQEALDEIRTVHANVNGELETELKEELLHKLTVKTEQLQEANYVASQLAIDISVDSPVLVQGQQTTVDMTVSNNGTHQIEDLNLELLAPDSWNVSSANESLNLDANETKTVSVNVTVPNDAEHFHPYDDPVLTLAIKYHTNGTEVEVTENPDETVAVLPEIGLKLNPENVVVNTADVQEEVEVKVVTTNYNEGNAEATVALDVPEGWIVENNEQKVTFSEKFEQNELTFVTIPPRDIEVGDFDIHAIATFAGKELNDTVQEIHYDHIDDSYYIYPAKVNGVAFELLSDADLKIGYVDSGMDEIADYLINIGLDITMLEEEDLATGDLSEYDTIITGIRAYMAREDLGEHNDRLLEYVANGGHLVTQHNLPAEWNGTWGEEERYRSPYPITAGTPSIAWRVTDQNAKVTVTQPDSHLFNYPNKINDSDWDNWVQERALYFPSEWSDEYETFVSMKDEGDPAPYTSGILMAEYGEGTHIYTNLVFYRQIQNQVPGGYRIFTNLITPPKVDEPVEEDLSITDVPSLDAIEMDQGTELDLPETIEVSLSDDTTAIVNVDWNDGEPAFDKDTPGTYTFTGTLNVTDGIQNPDNLQAEIQVIVNEVKIPEEPKEPEDPKEPTEPTDPETPGDIDDTDKPGGDKGTGGTNGDKTGDKLPKTATTLYNTLFIGLIILIVGGGLYFWYWRKNKLAHEKENN